MDGLGLFLEGAASSLLHARPDAGCRGRPTTLGWNRTIKGRDSPGNMGNEWHSVHFLFFLFAGMRVTADRHVWHILESHLHHQYSVPLPPRAPYETGCMHTLLLSTSGYIVARRGRSSHLSLTLYHGLPPSLSAPTKCSKCCYTPNQYTRLLSSSSPSP